MIRREKKAAAVTEASALPLSDPTSLATSFELPPQIREVGLYIRD